MLTSIKKIKKILENKNYSSLAEKNRLEYILRSMEYEYFMKLAKNNNLISKENLR